MIRVTKTNANLRTWFTTGARGLSSERMVEVFEGLPDGMLVGRFFASAYPHDPADLRRCVGLLDAVPEYRPRIPEMCAAGPEWAALAIGWPEIEALLREEMGSATGRAPRTYDRMREMIVGARPRSTDPADLRTDEEHDHDQR